MHMWACAFDCACGQVRACGWVGGGVSLKGPWSGQFGRWLVEFMNKQSNRLLQLPATEWGTPTAGSTVKQRASRALPPRAGWPPPLAPPSAKRCTPTTSPAALPCPTPCTHTLAKRRRSAALKWRNFACRWLKARVTRWYSSARRRFSSRKRASSAAWRFCAGDKMRAGPVSVVQWCWA